MLFDGFRAVTSEDWAAMQGKFGHHSFDAVFLVVQRPGFRFRFEVRCHFGSVDVYGSVLDLAGNVKPISKIRMSRHAHSQLRPFVFWTVRRFLFGMPLASRDVTLCIQA